MRFNIEYWNLNLLWEDHELAILFQRFQRFYTSSSIPVTLVLLFFFNVEMLRIPHLKKVGVYV